MQNSRTFVSVMMPVVFKLLVFVEVSLGLCGAACGAWAIAARQPMGAVIVAASVVAMGSALVFLAVLPRITDVPEEPAAA